MCAMSGGNLFNILIGEQQTFFWTEVILTDFK